MATIKDIARICNVAVSTVSYALNGSDQVSEATRERILNVAKELNYVPNAFARGLKSSKTNNIGVFVSGFKGPTHQQILVGMESVFRESDKRYNMLVTFVDDELRLVREQTVDLAVMMDSKMNSDIIVEYSKKLPIIVFDQELSADNIYSVHSSNKQGMYDRIQKLIDNGAKKIAYVQGAHLSYHNKRRYEAYLEVLANNNIEFDPEIVLEPGHFTEEKGREVFLKNYERLMAKGIDTICCANDELAYGVISVLKEKKVNIPNDIQVTGFDNLINSSLMHPSLSTVSVDWFNYGVVVAELALKILHSPEGVSNSLIISNKIVDRESTR